MADYVQLWCMVKGDAPVSYWTIKKREQEVKLVACRLLGHEVHYHPTKSGYRTWIGLCERCRAMPPDYVHGDKPGVTIKEWTPG